ncbi:hypothetical protein DAEQUDRAFT_724113 [Daedalea quercina L-15889]|uniref:Vacuolar ATPase assembly integral membrane protein VMA21 n=1 Tax=Daedalea quercina L-15889 TaxID=1314783 RepID=A0A165S648_9APHY|nr:hypothetical protein DAEQUDRAFT_724113 [Daedalea quercina L-15889]
MSGQAAPANVTGQAAQQSGILIKLLIFAAALAIAPVSSYFLSKDYLWDGNAVLAAITAIVAANIVLVSYVVLSIREERAALLVSPPSRNEPESKKEK